MRRLQLSPEKSATITLRQLNEVLHRVWVGYENSRHRGIGGIPAVVLQRRMAKEGRPMFDDIRQLERLIGDTAEVRMWKYSIDFKGERFHNRNGISRIFNQEPDGQVPSMESLGHS